MKDWGEKKASGESDFAVVIVVFMHSALGIVSMSSFNPINILMCSLCSMSFNNACLFAVSRAMPSLVLLRMINACFWKKCPDETY